MKDFAPHQYQMKAIEKMCQHPGAAMLLDPGMGKTAIALAAFTVCKVNDVVEAMLVVVPLRPLYLTWPAEVAKWTQFKDLKVSILHGTPAARLAALKVKADVYLINPENVAWLVELMADKGLGIFGTPPKMLVVDESTKFKNAQSVRFKALRTVIGLFDRAYILTGTPAPQSVEDLFAQFQIIDGGARLGRFITHFRKQYMLPEEVRVGGGRTITTWHPMHDAADRIMHRVADVSLRLQAEDYLNMPKLTVNDIKVTLPKAARETYHRLADDLYAKVAGGASLTAATAAAATMKLRQITNGVAYDTDQQAVLLHEAKLDALYDLVEEQSGQPLLVGVAFLGEVEAIRNHLKALGLGEIPYLGGGVSKGAADKIVADWNAGKLPVLLAHPTSVAHGLNLQAGGHAVCWFGLTWNLEEYIQLNGRVYRQGQDKPVVIHRIVVQDTVDEDVAEALGSKTDVQSAILRNLKKGPDHGNPFPISKSA